MPSNLPGNAGGFLERCAFGQIEDDLELRLVVEREHFYLHHPKGKQRQGGEQQHGDQSEEGPAPARPGDHRIHHAVIEAGEEVVGRVIVVRSGRLDRRVAAQHPDRRPRRDTEGDEQRKEHGRAGTDRNRPHVRSHQSADEGHRQHRGDDGPGGQHRGIADFADGIDGDVHQRPAGGRRQLAVSHDVLDDDDGVVHENADGEDQRKERDAVQRIAIEVENEQRESERDGDGEKHDERLAPSEEREDEQRHPEDGNAHVQKKLVGFLAGRGAVVPRESDRDIGGKQRTAQARDGGFDVAYDCDRIGPGALGNAESDGRFFIRCRAGAKKNIVGRFCGAFHDRCDVAQENRTTLDDADDQIRGVGGALQEAAGFEEDLAVAGGKRTGLLMGIGCAKCAGEVVEGKTTRGEEHGIDLHPQLTAKSADEGGLGDIRQSLDGVVQVRPQLTESKVVVCAAVEREGDNGNVVDAVRFDERRGDAFRKTIGVTG